jgi:hypothetical protein
MLKVIIGTPPPETPAHKVRERVKTAKPPSMLQCRRCGGREVIEAKTGVLYSGGRTKGGVKTLLCVLCLTKGERVVLL